MAVKTSIYLPDDLAEAWTAAKASGHTLADVLRAGLIAFGDLPRPVDEATLRRVTSEVVREELAAALGAAAPEPTAEPARPPAAEGPVTCTHPGVAKKARCRACGQFNT